MESAAIAGVIYAVLTIVALAILRQLPDIAGSDGEVAAWFGDAGNRTSLIVALNLVSFSSVAFLWFVAVIRRRIGDREDRFFSTVFLGSAILYVATFLTGAVALAAPAIAASMSNEASVDNASASVAVGVAAGMILVIGPRLQAVFILTTSTLILRTGAMPRWLAYLGYAWGIVLFVFPLVSEPLGIAFPIWVLIVSVTIGYTRSARHEHPGSADRDGHAD